MDIYCDHHNHDSDYDDDKLLLDDENTNTLESCAKCRRRSHSANGFVKPVLNTVNHSTVVIGNGCNDGLLDNMDSPLLINVSYIFNNEPRNYFNIYFYFFLDSV